LQINSKLNNNLKELLSKPENVVIRNNNNNNNILNVESSNTKENFVNWNCVFISDDDYIVLKSKKQQDLKIHQIAAIKVYEKIKEMKEKLSESQKFYCRIKRKQIKTRSRNSLT